MQKNGKYSVKSEKGDQAEQMRVVDKPGKSVIDDCPSQRHKWERVDEFALVAKPVDYAAPVLSQFGPNFAHDGQQ